MQFVLAVSSFLCRQLLMIMASCLPLTSGSQIVHSHPRHYFSYSFLVCFLARLSSTKCPKNRIVMDAIVARFRGSIDLNEICGCRLGCHSVNLFTIILPLFLPKHFLEKNSSPFSPVESVAQNETELITHADSPFLCQQLRSASRRCLPHGDGELPGT